MQLTGLERYLLRQNKKLVLAEAISSGSGSDENPATLADLMKTKSSTIDGFGGEVWDPKRDHPMLGKLLDQAFVRGLSHGEDNNFDDIFSKHSGTPLSADITMQIGAVSHQDYEVSELADMKDSKFETIDDRYEQARKVDLMQHDYPSATVSSIDPPSLVIEAKT